MVIFEIVHLTLMLLRITELILLRKTLISHLMAKLKFSLASKLRGEFEVTDGWTQTICITKIQPY